MYICVYIYMYIYIYSSTNSSSRFIVIMRLGMHAHPGLSGAARCISQSTQWPCVLTYSSPQLDL